MTREQKVTLARLVISVLLLIAGVAATHIFQITGWARLLIFLVPYLVIGYDILLEAAEGIVHGEVFDEDFLMAIATIGAFVLGEYVEAAAVMIFFQTGELFELVAVGRSRRSITALMDIRPDYANVVRDGKEERVSPEKVSVGEEIVVRAGEKIPIDGVITEGSTTLDAAALTGESVPVEAVEGSEVHSGCINITGVVKVRTTKEFGDSTASKILKLVESSGAKKSRSESFITKFARYYTPAVCVMALVLALAVPAVLMLLGMSAEWNKWIMRALIFLVISCPCALVISIPLSFFAGIGGAGGKGVLIKGSGYIEALSKARTVVFDKTGTVTRGVFEVVGVHHNAMEKEKLLEYAALAESCSNHPIAKSIVKAIGETPDTTRAAQVTEYSGYGVTAVIDGRNVAVGNDKLMKKTGVQYIPCRNSGTVIHVAIDGEYAGHILIADVIKPNAKKAVSLLRNNGVKKVVMLTGDGENAAKHVADEIGADEYHSSLLPQDKVDIEEKLLSGKDRGETLIFAGDGLNDAPSLARADIGIAMGALGSDAAVEAADVVIMDDDPVKISLAIRISKKCMRIVYENITFAIGVKLICLALGAMGLANMWFAVFADVGVMVIAVLNAIRALKIRD